MDKLTISVANSFQIYACKLLKTLYLFASLDPVILNAGVSVTEKTRHSSVRLSQDRDNVLVEVALRATLPENEYGLGREATERHSYNDCSGCSSA
jgi:hypothetical protein